MTATAEPAAYNGGMVRRNPTARPPRLDVVLSEQERRQRIAYAIRKYREGRSMSPPQLAEKVGRSRGTINDWEAGRSTPSLADLGPLSSALQVDPRVFAELPAIPADPYADYLVDQTVGLAVGEGLRRSRERGDGEGQ